MSQSRQGVIATSRKGSSDMFQRIIPNAILERSIQAQGHQCAYCTLPFGSVITHHGKDRITTAIADHWIPWANGGLSTNENCVASCDVCNGVKSSDHYDSLQSASREIMITRMQKRYVTLFIPTVASTMDYKEWQRQYTRWILCGD